MKIITTFIFNLILFYSFQLYADHIQEWRSWVQNNASNSPIITFNKTCEINKLDFHPTEINQALMKDIERVSFYEPLMRPSGRIWYDTSDNYYIENDMLTGVRIIDEYKNLNERDLIILNNIKQQIEKKKNNELIIILTGAAHSQDFFLMHNELIKNDYYFSMPQITNETTHYTGLINFVNLLKQEYDVEFRNEVLNSLYGINIEFINNLPFDYMLAAKGLFIHRINREIERRNTENLKQLNFENIWVNSDTTASITIPSVIFLMDIHKLDSATHIINLPEYKTIKESGYKKIIIGLEGFMSEDKLELSDIKKLAFISSEDLQPLIDLLDRSIRAADREGLFSHPVDGERVKNEALKRLKDMKKMQKEGVTMNPAFVALYNKLSHYKQHDVIIDLIGLDNISYK